MESVFYGFENKNIMNVEFMCGLLANYSKELSEAETYREKGDVQLKHAKLILDKVKNCSIPTVSGRSEQLGIKAHIAAKTDVKNNMERLWTSIVVLNETVGLSESTMKELQAKISSKIAQCDRSIQDHKKLLSD